MDLIRIFTTTAFADISRRYCNHPVDSVDVTTDNLLIDEQLFVDECRLHHGVLSDDQMRMIYGLFRDEWSEQFWDIGNQCIMPSPDDNGKSIFNVLFRLSNGLLRVKDGMPLVKFRHLFRWREITQVLGEDLLTAAYWAYKFRDFEDIDKDFPDFSDYPTVLHNDNPHLDYIFKTVRLCELHSHLKAATDTFSISWVCMMNHIGNREKGFREIAEKQDPSRANRIYGKVREAVSEACAIRITLWKYLNGKLKLPFKVPPSTLDEHLQSLDESTSEERNIDSDFDYIRIPQRSKLDIIAGERLFLFKMFSLVIRSNETVIHRLFFRYILRKNYIRYFLVQVNDNNGFGNFKRFQDLKSCLLERNYSKLLTKLPVWEASKFNHTNVYEARVAPHKKPEDLNKLYKDITDACSDTDACISVKIIYHFLKNNDTIQQPGISRDSEIREKVFTQSDVLKKIKSIDPTKDYATGIDAASSELYCRPEVFAQAFRFLKEHGYAMTFHAGEDFYDIADGLRAIFETVHFLEFDTGDRIGHALALGIDPFRFYADRHNYIALPQQWMLDNVVWLYFYARMKNVNTQPGTEQFLLSTFRLLLAKIGYSDFSKIDIQDYYQSMLLRGDNPKYYEGGRFNVDASNGYVRDSSSWNSFDLQYDNTQISEIRKFNQEAGKLYSEYHFNPIVKRNGVLIKSFVVPDSYPSLINDIQNQMIREISKRRIGIECCPSSNFRIGHLEKLRIILSFDSCRFVNWIPDTLLP